MIRNEASESSPTAHSRVSTSSGLPSGKDAPKVPPRTPSKILCGAPQTYFFPLRLLCRFSFERPMAREVSALPCVSDVSGSRWIVFTLNSYFPSKWSVSRKNRDRRSRSAKKYDRGYDRGTAIKRPDGRGRAPPGEVVRGGGGTEPKPAKHLRKAHEGANRDPHGPALR